MRIFLFSSHARRGKLVFAPLLVIAGMILAGCDAAVDGLTAPRTEKLDAAMVLRVQAEYGATAAAHDFSVALRPLHSSSQIVATTGTGFGLQLLNGNATPRAITSVLHRVRVHDPSRRIAMDAESSCTIKPGVYAIMDLKTDMMVGVLIVYPDCRMEIVPISV